MRDLSKSHGDLKHLVFHPKLPEGSSRKWEVVDLFLTGTIFCFDSGVTRVEEPRRLRMGDVGLPVESSAPPATQELPPPTGNLSIVFTDIEELDHVLRDGTVRHENVFPGAW
jgi:hypothetical protein